MTKFLSEPMRLTASSLSSFRRCPREYHYGYTLCRVRVTDSPALAIGKVMHEALALYWSKGMDGAVAYLNGIAADLNETDAAKIHAMLSEYNPPAERYKVVAVEQAFDVPIINPVTGRNMRHYRLAGKVDGLLMDAEGKRWVLEHKTTSEEIMGFGPYWQRLSIDQQIAYYMLATNAHGVLYDVLKKPGIRISKVDRETAKVMRWTEAHAYQKRCEKTIGADLEVYYQCREVHKTDEDLREAQLDLWQQAHMLADCYRQGFWPRNSGSCRSFFGNCRYLDVCTGRANIDDDALFRTKQESNEELVCR